MSTDKNRFSITVDDELYEKINDFRFERRLKSQSKAVNELMLIGISALLGNEVKLGPDISNSDVKLLKQYNSLDTHGKKIINTILDIEYERCSTSISAAERDDKYLDNVLNDIKDSNKKDVI